MNKSEIREHITEEWCWCKPTFEDGVWVHNDEYGSDLIEQAERGELPE